MVRCSPLKSFSSRISFVPALYHRPNCSGIKYLISLFPFFTECITSVFPFRQYGGSLRVSDCRNRGFRWGESLCRGTGPIPFIHGSNGRDGRKASVPFWRRFRDLFCLISPGRWMLLHGTSVRCAVRPEFRFSFLLRELRGCPLPQLFHAPERQHTPAGLYRWRVSCFRRRRIRKV